MQLVAGRTLAEQLREGPLPEVQTAHLASALADALAYVHARGVVHRDVKPANVLLDQHCHPYLSDFGIATVVDATQITSTGMLIGTAAYLAPEQVRGDPLGPGTDVYALALVLLECFTGRREYPGTPMEAALARLHRPPQIPDGLPAPMTPLLAAMTAADPAERPSATDIGVWLREGTPPADRTAVLGAPPPVPADTTSTAAVPPPWQRRHRKALLGGALLAAITAGTVLGTPLVSTTPAAVNPAPGVSLPSAPPTAPASTTSTPPVTSPPPVALPTAPANTTAEHPAPSPVPSLLPLSTPIPSGDTPSANPPADPLQNPTPPQPPTAPPNPTPPQNPTPRNCSGRASRLTVTSSR